MSWFSINLNPHADLFLRVCLLTDHEKSLRKILNMLESLVESAVYIVHVGGSYQLVVQDPSPNIYRKCLLVTSYFSQMGICMSPDMAITRIKYPIICKRCLVNKKNFVQEMSFQHFIQSPFTEFHYPWTKSWYQCACTFCK